MATFSNGAVHRALRKILAVGLAAGLLAFVLPPGAARGDAGILVTTLSNRIIDGDSLCSLPEAYLTAVYNQPAYGCSAGSGETDTITFAVTGTIGLSSTFGVGVSGGRIIIDGTGQSITLQGTETMDYLLMVPSGASLGLRNLTVTGAKRGVQVEGTLTTDDVAFHALTVSGISMTSGSLTVNGGSFEGNPTGISVQGSSSTASITGAIFTGSTGRALDSNGATLQATGCSFHDNPGGGLHSSGTLNLSNSVFTANQATQGAGVWAEGAATVSGCTFTGNAVTNVDSIAASGQGGAMYISASSTITGSTFSGNTASRNGGAIFNSGSQFRVLRSSFTDNQANGAAPTYGYGGSLYTSGGTLYLTNTTLTAGTAQSGAALFAGNAALNLVNNTIAGNTNLAALGRSIDIATAQPSTFKNNLFAATSGGAHCSPALNITTNLNNLSTDASCGSAGQVTEAELALGTLLAYNDAPPVVPLLPGSAAVDAADDATCTSAPVSGLDQRGLGRIQGAHCDVGAFESRGFSLTKTGGDHQTALLNLPFSAPLRVSVTSLADPPEPVDGGRVHFTPPSSGASAVLSNNVALISAGSASVTATANDAIAAYTVTTSASGAAPVSFSLTNVEEEPQPGPQLTVTNLQEHSVGVCGPLDCTLREAMLAAIEQPGANSILFNLSGAISLSAPLPVVAPSGGPLTIDGAGQSVTLSGGGEQRVLQVDGGATLTLRSLTIIDGAVAHTSSDYGDGGAGLYNNGGTVNVEGCTFSGHVTGANTNGGAAIFNGSGGSLTVSASLVAENDASAGDGGAIFNQGGTLSVTNSTFTANQASVHGGAVANLGSAAAVNLTHVTLAGNLAGAGGGGGVYNLQGALTLTGSILADNAAGNCAPGAAGLLDGGGNVTWGDATCAAINGLNADPRLAPLADNGGPARSMALQAGSSALERAAAATCPAVDQAGRPRPNPAGTPCDAGALESGLRPPPTLQLAFTPGLAVMRQPVELSFTVANPNLAGGLSGLAFSDALPENLVVAPQPQIANTCGGTVSADPGAALITLDAGAVPAGGTCRLTVQVIALATGSLADSAGAVSSNESGVGLPSATASLTVDRWASSTAISAHSPDPSMIGAPLTVSFAVAGGAFSLGLPTGSVTVSDGLTQCSGDLTAGAGSCALPLTVAGARTLSAAYSGDLDFAGSVAAPTDHTVTKAGVTINIISYTPQTTVAGQAVTVGVNVAALDPDKGVPGGQVTLGTGEATCTLTLAADGAGSCDLTLPHAQSYSLTAVYAGDATFAGATSPARAHTVDSASTQVGLSTVPSEARFGGPVTFAAAVSVLPPGGGTPAGPVTFMDGSQELGTAELNSSGQAVLTTSALAFGAHTVTAVYAATADFTGAFSTTTLDVLPAATALTLTTPANPSVYGQTLALTAAVAALPPGGGLPEGSVSFTAAGEAIPGCVDLPLTAGSATCAYLPAEVDAHTLVAHYNGAANAYQASTSEQIEQVVTKAATSLALRRVGQGPLPKGRPVWIEFDVNVTAPGSGQPTGEVTVWLGGATCTVDVSAGGCDLVPSASGVLALSGSYSGDPHFTAATLTGLSVHLDEYFPLYLPLITQ